MAMVYDLRHHKKSVNFLKDRYREFLSDNHIPFYEDRFMLMDLDLVVDNLGGIQKLVHHKDSTPEIMVWIYKYYYNTDRKQLHELAEKLGCL